MKRAAVHKDLRTPKYRMRVVTSKKIYKRKQKNLSEKLYHDYFDSNSGRVYL